MAESSIAARWPWQAARLASTSRPSDRPWQRILAVATPNQLGGLQQLGNAQAHTHTLTLRPSFNVNATWIHGSHTVKAGGEVWFQGNITAPPSGVLLSFNHSRSNALRASAQPYAVRRTVPTSRASRSPTCCWAASTISPEAPPIPHGQVAVGFLHPGFLEGHPQAHCRLRSPLGLCHRAGSSRPLREPRPDHSQSGRRGPPGRADL